MFIAVRTGVQSRVMKLTIKSLEDGGSDVQDIPRVSDEHMYNIMRLKKTGEKNNLSASKSYPPPRSDQREDLVLNHLTTHVSFG